MELTIKINKSSIGDIIQTFNRYDYTIKASYQDNEADENIKERLDFFMNYINI